MQTCKEKFIEELDKNMASLLKQENLWVNIIASKDQYEPFDHSLLYAVTHTYETLMRFANNVIGKHEVQKLCDKHGVRNRYT